MNTVAKFFFILTSIITCCFFSSCCDENTKVSRTVFAYMVGGTDFNLSNALLKNIKNMENAANQGVLNSGNLIIYIDSANDTPYLLKIEKGKRIVIKKYPEQNSSDPTIMKEVFNEVFTQYPADSYGLILASHASGWLPTSTEYYKAPKRTLVYPNNNSSSLAPFILETRWILKNGENKMDINTLNDVLETAPHFNFILFDACFMSNVESLYTFRDKADYFIASPTEVNIYGFPYDRVLEHMFKPTIDLRSICDRYYQFYLKYKSPYGSIALIQANKLEPLANVISEIMANNPGSYPNPFSTQKYDQRYVPIFFDLADMAKQLATTEQYNQLLFVLKQAILYKASTLEFGLTQIDPNRFSGISTYIPYSSFQDLNAAWPLTEWGEHILP